MADYTLGDFRRLTKDLPDDTPMINSRWSDEFCDYSPVHMNEPEIMKIGDDSMMKETSDIKDIESKLPNSVLSVVIV